MLYDIKGIPIKLGDLVRTNHFKDRTAHKKQRYLYHIISNRSGNLEFVPLIELVTGKKDGGCFWYLDSFQHTLTCEKAEVLTGVDWPWDREINNDFKMQRVRKQACGNYSE